MLKQGQGSLDPGGGSGSSRTGAESDSRSLTSGSEITPEQEYFLYELESTDSGSIGLVLRAIYDGGDVHKFLRALEKKIRHYDRDIEKLCSYHYQGFIEAIRELLQLKTQCQALKDDVECIDQHLEESSRTMLNKAKEMVRYRKLQKNIAGAIDRVSICLPMLEKYSKLQELMQNKRYYPALKTLEQLEHTYLPQVERYRFTSKLMESVSHIREEIKDSSFSEFTDFLENIRKVSAKIGEVSLKHTAEAFDAEADSNRMDDNRRENAKRRILSPERAPAEENFTAQDMVDFSPVYRCCHIFSVLDAKESFDLYYRKQRREQAAILLRAPDRMHGNLESYLGYFHEVIGFFVIEDHIMQTASGLVTRSYREELWELALQQVSKTLNNHFGNCTDAQVMLKIKRLIMLFALTLKSYGFQVASFYKLLQNFRDQYNEILMTDCCASFDHILKDDNYTPITVQNKDEYELVVRRFPFFQRGFEQAPYPKKFPFSEFVPTIFQQLKAYVHGCLRFTDQLGLSQSEIDDMVRRYANVLLDRLSGSLSSFVSNRKLSLIQLVQITINMGYLEKGCELLEQHIVKSTSDGHQLSSSTAHLVKLKEDVFRDARSEVEQQIDDSLSGKIEAFIELANYDWELTTSHGQASEYVKDLNSFLNTTFLSFTNLPPMLARHVCLQACKFLAGRLLGLLTDPSVKCVSPGALAQFSLDLMQCELWTSQCPVPGFEDGTLGLIFADLRQLMELFEGSDWSAYLADFGHERSKYARVQPQTVIIVLEKIVELEKKKNSLFGKGKDKDKKKLLDTVLKQLRTLANSTHQG